MPCYLVSSGHECRTGGFIDAVQRLAKMIRCKQKAGEFTGASLPLTTPGAILVRVSAARGARSPNIPAHSPGIYVRWGHDYPMERRTIRRFPTALILMGMAGGNR